MPRVLVHATNPDARQVCQAVLTMVSLMPGLLQEGLSLSAVSGKLEAQDNFEDISGVSTPDLASRLHNAGCPLDVFGEYSYLQPYATLFQV